MRTVYIKLRLQFRLIVVFLISIIVTLVQLCKEISPKALPDHEELKDYFAEVVAQFFKTPTNCVDANTPNRTTNILAEITRMCKECPKEVRT